VIQQRHTSLSANDFTKVEITDKTKGFAAPAWIRVPGTRPSGSEHGDEVVAVALRFLVPPEETTAFTEQVLIPSFTAADIALHDKVSFDNDGPFVCLNVSVLQVLGLWIDHLGELLKLHARGMRIVVGACTSSSRSSARREARELASSDQAAQVLAAARGSQVVIVVPGHVHHEISRNPGRLVMPDNYVRAGSSWLRVLGYAKPPHPLDRVRNAPNGTPPPGVGSVTAIGNRATAMGPFT
jgi:hypothetical protein